MKSSIKSNIITTKFFIQDNKLTLVFITLFTIGIAVGSFSLMAAGEHRQTLVSVLNTYFVENQSLSLITLFSRCLVSNFIYLSIVYIGGLCAIGLPFIGIIPIIKGISLGTIISYKYIFDSVKGFLYSLIIFFLPAALLLSIFCYAYSEGIYMSLTVSNGIFNSKPREIKYSLSFMSFTKRMIVFSLAVVMISFLQALLMHLFSKLL